MINKKKPKRNALSPRCACYARPLILFHCTTEKKAKAYRASGCIHSPVRGFDSLPAALAWCVKTGRKVVYEIQCKPETVHKLPDHHNSFGCAWWIDEDVKEYKCAFSAVKDA